MAVEIRRTWRRSLDRIDRIWGRRPSCSTRPARPSCPVSPAPSPVARTVLTVENGEKGGVRPVHRCIPTGLNAARARRPRPILPSCRVGLGGRGSSPVQGDVRDRSSPLPRLRATPRPPLPRASRDRIHFSVRFYPTNGPKYVILGLKYDHA